MFEWLAAAATSAILGSSSTPGMLQKFRESMQMKGGVGKQRTYTSADIQCVANAVAAREGALSAGAKTHGDAVAAAYAARASALPGAYTGTSTPAIRHAVKGVWEIFNASIRTARKAWQAARDQAWREFRSAVKNCKAPADVVDSANASSEPSGE